MKDRCFTRLICCLLPLLLVPLSGAADPLPPHMVELNAQLSHSKLLVDAPQDFYAVIDLQALQAEVEERPAMNLALVIDRSGSMRGERIHQARQAALHLVDSLTEADRLALVTYGTDYTVEFDSTVATAENREQMRAVIKGIREEGWTNLSGGFEAGVEIVARHHNSESINRVLMLSDGHANRGITDPAQLRALARQAFDRGVSTSTIGFGLDYNEGLMTGMAVEGTGSYYFVDDGQDLAALIQTEIAGLSATVANRIEVILDPGPGVEVVDVLGFSHRYRDGKVHISLSELSAGHRRSIVVALTITAQDVQSQEILSVRANYRDAVNDRLRYRLQILQAEITDDEVLVDRHVNRDVLSRVEEVRLAENINRAMEAYAAGNRAKAQTMLEEESRRSQQVRQQHNLSSERLQRLDASYERIGNTVQQAPASSQGARRMRMEASEESFQIMRH